MKNMKPVKFSSLRSENSRRQRSSGLPLTECSCEDACDMAACYTQLHHGDSAHSHCQHLPRVGRYSGHCIPTALPDSRYGIKSALSDTHLGQHDPCLSHIQRCSNRSCKATCVRDPTVRRRPDSILAISTSGVTELSKSCLCHHAYLTVLRTVHT